MNNNNIRNTKEYICERLNILYNLHSTNISPSKCWNEEIHIIIPYILYHSKTKTFRKMFCDWLKQKHLLQTNRPFNSTNECIAIYRTESNGKINNKRNIIHLVFGCANCSIRHVFCCDVWFVGWNLEEIIVISIVIIVFSSSDGENSFRTLSVGFSKRRNECNADAFDNNNCRSSASTWFEFSAYECIERWTSISASINSRTYFPLFFLRIPIIFVLNEFNRNIRNLKNNNT